MQYTIYILCYLFFFVKPEKHLKPKSSFSQTSIIVLWMSSFGRLHPQVLHVQVKQIADCRCLASWQCLALAYSMFPLRINVLSSEIHCFSSLFVCPWYAQSQGHVRMFVYPWCCIAVNGKLLTSVWMSKKLDISGIIGYMSHILSFPLNKTKYHSSIGWKV